MATKPKPKPVPTEPVKPPAEPEKGWWERRD